MVGIGTNVVAAPEGTPTPAISLAALGVQMSAPRNCLRRCRTPGLSFAASGTMVAALAKSAGSGWRARPGSGRRVAITSGGATIEGTFDTIDEKGMYDRPDRGRQADARSSAGDVYFGSAASRGTSLMARPDELTFAPLGGVGEIGMNLSIYGLGNRHQRTWLAVDLGVSFGDEEHLPGIDLIMPDIRFLEKERKNLVALVLTHAHEDHFGAIIDLWPKLKCPIYATKFSAALFEAKCASERNPPKNPGHRRCLRRPHRYRPVQCRVHPGRAFDSGIACAGDPYRGRHRAAYR